MEQEALDQRSPAARLGDLIANHAGKMWFIGLHVVWLVSWIAILLLKWLHHLSQAKWPLSNLASMLRLNRFSYRDLHRWLENPFGTPPLIPPSEQLTLVLD